MIPQDEAHPGGAVLAALTCCLASSATLFATGLVGLYDQTTPVVAPVMGVALICVLRCRVAGMLGVGAAFFAHQLYLGVAPAPSAMIAAFHALAALLGGRLMSLAHRKGLTYSNTRQWLVLFFAGVWPATLTIIAGRGLMQLAQLPGAVDPFAIMVEAIANILGGMAAAACLGQLRHLRRLSPPNRVELLFIAAQISLSTAFWLSVRNSDDIQNQTTALLLAGVPMSIGIALGMRTIPAGLLSNSTIFFCVAVVLAAQGGAMNSQFTLSHVFFLVLLISGQLVHQISMDYRGALAKNIAQNAELETRVTERTADLEAMTRRAMQADAAKSEFLAMMTHELRTPMNGVLGMSELLQNTQLDDRQRALVSVIHRSGASLLTLINDILDFSRIDAGELRLSAEIFDTGEILDAHLTPLISAARDKGVGFIARIDPATPAQMRGDPTRLRQIIINYLGNALKFTDQGEIRLDVGPGAQGGLRIIVRDTGCGVAKDQLGTIFEKFNQADASETRRHQGAGLGLAICRGLAEAMGGRVWADSVKGQGSTFGFEAPLESVPGPVMADLLRPAAAGRRVVILDEDAAQAGIAAEAFRAAGAEPTRCDGFESAAALLRRRRCDLVLITDAFIGRVAALAEAAQGAPRFIHGYGVDSERHNNVSGATPRPYRLPALALSLDDMASADPAAPRLDDLRA